MAAVGHHRAPRGARATWIRIALALALLIPALAVLPRTAIAADAQVVELLKDLTGDSAGSEPDDFTAPVKSGSSYFFSAYTLDHGWELWKTTGTPGNAVMIELQADGAGSYPSWLIPFSKNGTDGVLFFADLGSEESPYQLVWTDGTTTTVLKPEGAGDDPDAGYFNYGFEPVVAGSKYFFGGYAYTTASGAGTPAIFRVNSDLSVTDALDAYGFNPAPADLTGSGWGNSYFNVFLAGAGDYLYASLTDCDAVDCSSNVHHYKGRELWFANVSLNSPVWTITGNLSPGDGVDTTFDYVVGSVDNDLYFAASGPVGRAFYASSAGSSPSLILDYSEQTPAVYEPNLGDDYRPVSAHVDSAFYFVTSSAPPSSVYKLWRTVGGPATEVADCSTYSIDVMASMGSYVYFPCAGSGTGVELYRQTGSSDAEIVKDYVPGDATKAAEPYSLAVLDNKLYYAGFLPSNGFSGAEPGLFVYSGTGEPAEVDLGSANNAFGLQTAVDRLFFWANDATHNDEPWVIRPAWTLTVSRNGTGAGGVSGTGITCSGETPDCTEKIVAGSSIQLSASASTGSAFLGWSGATCGGGGESSTTATCTVTPTAATTVTAKFGLKHTLTVQGLDNGNGTITGGGINCSYNGSSTGTCSNNAVAGTVTLTATATLGTFVDWNGSCPSEPSPGQCQLDFEVIQDDKLVSAVFRTGAIDRTLTVNFGGSGTGTVSSSPRGISCSAVCSATFANGTSVTLTAKPGRGSLFTGWTGQTCGEATQTGTSCTLTMNTNRTIAATFQLSRTVTVTKSGSGSGSVITSPSGISCGSVCSGTFADGQTILLTATGAAGATFLWGGDAATCGTASPCSLEVNSNKNITIAFTASGSSFSVSVGTPRNGTISSTSPSTDLNCGTICVWSWASGATVTLRATWNAGYGGATWSGCPTTPTVFGSYSQCSFTLSANTSLKVRFTR